MVLWDEVFKAVAKDYPDVQTSSLLVDAAAMDFVRKPETFDVVVASNLFGDILTDLSAIITGSMGLAASANINPERTYPSMFEPVHGSAPDIAGKGIANPLAAILSAGMLLDHLGLGQSGAGAAPGGGAVLQGRQAAHARPGRHRHDDGGDGGGAGGAVNQRPARAKVSDLRRTSPVRYNGGDPPLAQDASSIFLFSRGPRASTLRSPEATTTSERIVELHGDNAMDCDGGPAAPLTKMLISHSSTTEWRDHLARIGDLPRGHSRGRWRVGLVSSVAVRWPTRPSRLYCLGPRHHWTPAQPGCKQPKRVAACT